MRKTKVICTLGPAVDNEEMLRALILGGMNCARFNFSHGNHEEQLARLNMFKRVRDTLGSPVATMLDTKGPEIRIKTFANGPVTLEKGARFVRAGGRKVHARAVLGQKLLSLADEQKPGKVFAFVCDVPAEKAKPLPLYVRADNARIPALFQVREALHGGIGIDDVRLRKVLRNKAAALQNCLLVRIQRSDLFQPRADGNDQPVFDGQKILLRRIQGRIGVQKVEILRDGALQGVFHGQNRRLRLSVQQRLNDLEETVTGYPLRLRAELCRGEGGITPFRAEIGNA